MFFAGFDLTQIAVPAGELRVRIGGSGPALLLLHGTPQTHAMWHALADRLAGRFTVICPDLRGHGGSFKPEPSADHANHAAAAMALDMVALMTRLGHPDFAIGGHGRGTDVARRIALQHPARVTHLLALDSVPPTPRADPDLMAGALARYPGLWFFEPLPLDEHVVSLAPDAWFNGHGDGRPRAPAYLHPQALDDYLAAAASPSAIAGMTQSFRAAAGIDRHQEAALLAGGHRIACPTTVLWSAHGHLGGWYDPRHLWQAICTHRVDGAAIEAGPHLAEEAPDQVADWFHSALRPAEAAVA
jgi:haloacetate dehalogenase